MRDGPGLLAGLWRNARDFCRPTGGVMAARIPSCERLFGGDFAPDWSHIGGGSLGEQPLPCELAGLHPLLVAV